MVMLGAVNWLRMVALLVSKTAVNIGVCGLACGMATHLVYSTLNNRKINEYAEVVQQIWRIAELTCLLLAVNQ